MTLVILQRNLYISQQLSPSVIFEYSKSNLLKKCMLETQKKKLTSNLNVY